MPKKIQFSEVSSGLEQAKGLIAETREDEEKSH
jgi:hypothetical protein